MTLLNSLMKIPHNIKESNSFRSILKTLKLYTILKKIHKTSLRIIMGIKYGKNFTKYQIGTISVADITFKMYDPSLEYLSEAVAGKNYEPAVTNHLASLIAHKKCCFLDIGSFFGYFTIFVGSLNKECEIHAFEPNAKYFDITKKNVEINQLQVKLHRIALSDETADIPFADRSMKITHGMKSEIVQAIPFDDLAKKENIHPEIVKLDVHGSEGKVLFGMKCVLKNDIKHIYCELHPSELLVGYTIKDCVDLLRESGFTLYEFNRFRKEKTPDMSKITDESYLNLIDTGKWTEEQVNARRMIYATKEPSTVNPNRSS